MWWTTIQLRYFPLNRRPISTQVPPLLGQVQPRGALIEPGAQWYKGGNVMVFLLFHNLFLFVFPHCCHIFFGMCLSRRGSDSWPKLRKLGVRSDVGLGLSLCAVPLLQFGSQRSEEVRLECRSKVVAQTMIKISERRGGNKLEASETRGIRPKQAGGCRTQ